MEDFAAALRANNTLKILSLDGARRWSSTRNASGRLSLARGIMLFKFSAPIVRGRSQYLSSSPPPPCAPSLPGPHTPAFLKSALAGNRLTSAGVVSLASGLRQNSTLTTLSLSRNHVADEGAIALARAIECSPSGNPACALRLLSLCDTGVQEPGAEALRDALASNTSLHELDFATNPCLASILAPLHPRVRVE